ncbi:hypothetical protein HGRIS_008806 [Hohenbuehelia grisea]
MLPRVHRALSGSSSSFFILFSSTASSSKLSEFQRRRMSVKAFVDDAIADNKVAIFSKSYCPYCRSAKALFASNYPDIQTVIYELDERDDGDAIQDYLQEKTGQRTVPNIFVNKQHVGGNDKVTGLQSSGKLAALVNA